MITPTNLRSQLVPSLTCGEVEEIVNLLINTRDFCGNQTPALREWLIDNDHKIPANQFYELLSLAQTAWAGFRRQAAAAANA